MTNMEIIMGEMILNDINLDLDVDTFAGWKRRGFTVKKGEHAVFKTRIWKPRKKAQTEEPQQETAPDPEQPAEERQRFSLRNRLRSWR